ncbi:MAG: hypothetical protein ACRBFS_10130 [Aureispira sp.]
MKNMSPKSIQLTVNQCNRPFAKTVNQPIQVNSWVNTALAKRQVGTTNRNSSQMVEVHFAFSKSILNRR